MPTSLLILASILTADGPPPVPLDQREVKLAELLSYSWCGTWTREGETAAGVTVRQGVFAIPMNPPLQMRQTNTTEGHGCFRGAIGKMRRRRSAKGKTPALLDVATSARQVEQIRHRPS